MPCCLLPGRSLALVSTTFFEVPILTTAVNSIPASSLLQFLEKSLPQKGREVSHRPLQSPHELKFPLGCCLNLVKGEDDSSLWHFLHNLMTCDSVSGAFRMSPLVLPRTVYPQNLYYYPCTQQKLRLKVKVSMSSIY